MIIIETYKFSGGLEWGGSWDRVLYWSYLVTAAQLRKSLAIPLLGRRSFISETRGIPVEIRLCAKDLITIGYS